MKITKDLTLTLLKESASFRAYVADLLFCDFSELKALIIKTVMQADGKIDAIKKIREIAQNQTQGFKEAFDDLEWHTSYDGKETLGLATSKRFVESIRNFD